MTKRTRPTFTPEFKLESAQLVVDQGYSIREAAEAMNVGKSTMERFFRSYKTEWMPEMGFRNYAQAKQSILEYILGYYSQVRPHQHNGVCHLTKQRRTIGFSLKLWPKLLDHYN